MPISGYIAEYAKSGRAGCRKCKNTIGKSSLRIATLIPAKAFSGDMKYWYHYRCFFEHKKQHGLEDETQIQGFDSLRWEDQERVRKRISGEEEEEEEEKDIEESSDDEEDSDDQDLQNKSIENNKENLNMMNSGRKLRSRNRRRSSNINKTYQRDISNDQISNQDHPSKKRSLRRQRRRVNIIDSDSDNDDQLNMNNNYNNNYNINDNNNTNDNNNKSNDKVLQNLNNETQSQTQSRRRSRTRTRTRSRTISDKTLSTNNSKTRSRTRTRTRTRTRSRINNNNDNDNDNTRNSNNLISRKRKYSSFSNESSENEINSKDRNSSNNPPDYKRKKLRDVAKPEDSLRKKLQLQNEKVWNIRDKLNVNCSTKELKLMLEENEMITSGGRDTLLDRCADGMCFGVISRCPECGGHLEYRNAFYHCVSHADEWTSCSFRTRDIKRLEWNIPEELNETNDYLNSFRFQITEKALPPIPVKMEEKRKEAKQKIEEQEAKKKNENENNSQDQKNKLKLTFKGRGAVDPESGMVENGKIYEERVEFIDDNNENDENGSESESENDDCENCEDKSTDSNRISRLDVYNVMLMRTDLARDINSFYCLQLIESESSRKKSQRKWHVWKRWGRLGTTRGSSQLKTYLGPIPAKKEFQAIYFDKTGNDWRHRHRFEKMAGKYHQLDLGFEEGEELDQVSTVSPGSKTNLDERVQDVVTTLFDVQSMRAAMVEMEIDLNQMPLGKLSSRALDAGFDILDSIKNILHEAQEKDQVEHPSTQRQFIRLSSKFYTCIPHQSSASSSPPLIDDNDRLSSKFETLRNLRDIELATSIIKDPSIDPEEDPIDIHYRKLASDISIVEKDSPEFRLLSNYVSQTHGPTHDHFTLEVEEIYRVDRSHEQRRFQAKLDTMTSPHNRMLLWHGSRLTNYVGILSQGLRIAPPEAPKTGYMFGKGVYFADMCSKSANYCHATPENPTGYLLLADVALGDSYELNRAKYMDAPPRGKDSTKGVGQYEPDPEAECTLEDGVRIPQGKWIESDHSKAKRSKLLYNEFIVYDTDQANIRYMFKMKFHFK